jgi:SRSO17 transposase
MDAKQIRQLKPILTRYLKQFDDCFARRDTRAHFSTYVEGQLSDLGEKSCEPIALAAGIPPRTLQEFLSTYRWEEDRTRNRLQKIVIRDHSGRNSVGIIDETSDVKQGDKTPGVKRQWCGTVGKTENCIVTVHLAYATGDFHCLLDGDLFLPEDWSADRERCRAAGIPDDVVYRPKWKIALELLDRAKGNRVTFDWLTFDEGYGGKPEFLRELHGRKQRFVGEVPKTFTGWIHEPCVTERPFRRAKGRGRKTPRMVAGSRPAISVANMLKYSPELRDQEWVRYRVKDGEK